ncbi:MAG: AraC family transcriptional regulator [Xanthomonadales bacterium]|nr:AraC family transcriptional regulator [Xanthomonadales bacterium]
MGESHPQGTAERQPRAPQLLELAQWVAQRCSEAGLHPTPLPALSLIRADQTVDHLPAIYEPSLCVVVQGRKRALLGDEQFEYNPGHFLVVSMTLPVIAQITEASPQRPYLCLRLEIDAGAVADLLMQSAPEPVAAAGRGLYLESMSQELADAFLRLLRVLDQPAELSVLAPMLTREIYFRVLGSSMGARLRDLVDSASHARRIAAAIELIKQRFDQNFSVAEIAEQVHVSPSTLHHRFKALTAMTPLQFQKQLRLHEARRLMLSEGLGAASAGHRVGYGSPSQFSREYRRLFGQPPRRALQLLGPHAA